MVNHWYLDDEDRTACGEYAGHLAFSVSTHFPSVVSCPECATWCETSLSEVEDRFDNRLIDILGEIRGLMQDRHAKYGPGNIAKRGIDGILVRLEDKLARLDSGNMDHSDEKYRDAWMDVVGYGLIALMWVDGSWPGSPHTLATDPSRGYVDNHSNERGA